MKLITWNCQGAFRKKADLILTQKPDILVVQECECLEKLLFNSTAPKPKDSLWIGDNQHKGVGIFSYGNHRFQIIEQHNPEFKTVLPIAVSGGAFDFTLFAIWANNPHDKGNQYIEQVWRAINHYDTLLDNGPAILMGDFNSNSIWDKKRREGNHSTVVKRLADKNIHSLYHKHQNQEQGKETQPTFYLQRNINKPYHLDYCFASADIYGQLSHFKIGNFGDWIAYSDHLPLMVEFGD